MESYSQTDYELVIQLCGVSKCQILTRQNVLIVLLEYINFSIRVATQNNYLGGLPYLLSFYTAVFNFKYSYYDSLSILCSNLFLLCQHFALCFCLPIIPIVLPANQCIPIYSSNVHGQLKHIKKCYCTCIWLAIETDGILLPP